MAEEWSFNGVGEEVWGNGLYPTKELAVAAGRRHHAGSAFVVGRFKPVDLSLDFGRSVLEMICDAARDQAGGASDCGFRPVPDAIRPDLSATVAAAVRRWHHKHGLEPMVRKVFDREVVAGCPAFDPILLGC